MDPYIDPEALDPSHPLTSHKLENLAKASALMENGAVELDSLPSKITFQTTDVCNLSCPHCQIPKAFKVQAMPASFLDLLAEKLLPSLIELHPTNLGEPFSWPHFKRLCLLMNDYGVVLDLTTNGTLLNQSRMESPRLPVILRSLLTVRQRQHLSVFGQVHVSILCVRTFKLW